MARRNSASDDTTDARFEFRVWGRHKKARKLLGQLADEVVEETVEDCYFIVDGETVNAKVRARELKVKQLVGSDQGFERWVHSRYRHSDDMPQPYAALFERLRAERERMGGSFDLAKAVKKLDKAVPASVVLVTKRRRRYCVGALKAEATDITIDRSGTVLRTLAIEGDDVDELVTLRTRLGLKGEDNIAVHVAIEADL